MANLNGVGGIKKEIEMLKFLMVLPIFAFILGCGASTSGNITIDPKDLQYFQDPRTNLCFAIVGSGKYLDPDTTGVAMANVPCTDEVLQLARRR